VARLATRHTQAIRANPNHQPVKPARSHPDRHCEARAASATSRGTDVRSPAQFRKAERKPWTVASTCARRDPLRPCFRRCKRARRWPVPVLRFDLHKPTNCAVRCDGRPVIIRPQPCGDAGSNRPAAPEAVALATSTPNSHTRALQVRLRASAYGLRQVAGLLATAEDVASRLNTEAGRQAVGAA
jgi:hypothetical protein